jgi:hypothetical protein
MATLLISCKKMPYEAKSVLWLAIFIKRSDPGFLTIKL